MNVTARSSGAFVTLLASLILVVVLLVIQAPAHEAGAPQPATTPSILTIHGDPPDPIEVSEELKKAEPERDVRISIANGLNALGDASLLRVLLQNLIGILSQRLSHANDLNESHARMNRDLSKRVDELEQRCRSLGAMHQDALSA